MIKLRTEVIIKIKGDKSQLDNATILMPLTTNNKKKDLEIQQKVWNYCVAHNIKYTPRIHVDVWGNRRKV